LKLLKQAVLFLLSALALNAAAQTGDYLEAGTASFYHDKFVGRKTASGQRFSQKELTCAHRTLPFGTKLKVTNLKTGKAIVVTVNDRGPFKKGRVIDLSRKGATELGFMHDGITSVAIELVSEPGELFAFTPLNDSIRELYCVETHKPVSIKIGDFETQERLKEIVQQASAELGREVLVQTVQNSGDTSYIVFVGIFYRQEDAHDFLDQIEHYYPKAEVSELALAAN
jgi:rare lipoprotein A